MTKSRTLGRGPSLVLAGGVLACTILAVLFSHSAWLALLGPAILAFIMIGVSALTPLPHVARRRAIRLAIILGSSLLLASVILAMTDPALLVRMLPILGGSTAAGLAIAPLSRSSC